MTEKDVSEFGKMWRFLPNVSNPDANKTSTKTTNKRDRDPGYDKTKRRRSYRKEWELQYKWLAYDEEGRGDVLQDMPGQ